jgi:hypothetical protein
LCFLFFSAETPLVSFWVTHWVCLILLMILCCGNSLLVRGVYIDGEEEGGQCVVFQVNYLRYHYKVSVFLLLYLKMIFFLFYIGVCNLTVIYGVFQYPNLIPIKVQKNLLIFVCRSNSWGKNGYDVIYRVQIIRG